MIEYNFLNNAVQMSSPEDFDESMGVSVRHVFESFSTILSAFTKLGAKNLNFRLEDERYTNGRA